MKRRLYIVPGFGENTHLASYQKVIHAARNAGYEVISYNPKWDRRVPTHWIQDFKKLLSTNNTGESYVFGFSFGAYIAVLSAQDAHFKKMILCSLSPYFLDNLKEIPLSAWKFFGKRRRNDFAKHTFPTDILSTAFFLVGEKEIPLELRHVKNRYKVWRGRKRHIIVKGAEHALESGDYIKEIVNIIKKP